MMQLYLNMLCFMQLSSSYFLRASGLRKAVVPSSRGAVIVDNESDPSCPQITDASPGGLRKVYSGQRSSPVMSSEHNHMSTGRNTSNIRHLESAQIVKKGHIINAKSSAVFRSHCKFKEA